MGRKTFESLGRVLPNRKHVVITKNKDFEIQNSNVEIVTDIKEIEKYINQETENFVIGGATIYKMLMPYASKMYITKIYEEFDGDVFFPEINEDEWSIVEREKGVKNEQNPFDYEYITYVRK